MTTATTEMPFPKAEYEPTVWMPGQKVTKGYSDFPGRLKTKMSLMRLCDDYPQVEVTWFVAANHVGGYQFRLCKLKNNLSRKDVSEECFRSADYCDNMQR